ncbi:unnamed protein product [Cylicocyclus nassatus]|uniref:Uncharacterized protein n=1 Tax=Cylicocyclus nassatus TaxID=53992 RepID=A0AA36DUE5_CYLNA|nr:unnamed protein product [Cylicocyclus nassatus]
MFDSYFIIFLECVVVLVPLYYSLVAARWIDPSPKAMRVLSTATSAKKHRDVNPKKIEIDHGDSVSPMEPDEIERKIEHLQGEIGDSVLQNPSRTSTFIQT